MWIRNHLKFMGNWGALELNWGLFLEKKNNFEKRKWPEELGSIMAIDRETLLKDRKGWHERHGQKKKKKKENDRQRERMLDTRERERMWEKKRKTEREIRIRERMNDKNWNRNKDRK